MSYYNKIKKLDEESLEQLTEGSGPSDQCICSLLSPPEDEKSRIGAMGASIKKVFASFGGKKNKAEKQGAVKGMTSVDIPLSFAKGGKGVYTTKEAVKRGSSCGKCGCDKEKFVLKHSFANIRITSPDISSVCPCPTDCLPDRAKLQNNINVTVEHVQAKHRIDQLSKSVEMENKQKSGRNKRKNLDPDSVDSEFSILEFPQRFIVSEPVMEKRSVTELINDQYDDESYSDWSYED